MGVVIRFVDGSTTVFHDKFDSEEAFWKFYKQAIALEVPFVFGEKEGVKHYFNFKQIVAVDFISKPETKETQGVLGDE